MLRLRLFFVVLLFFTFIFPVSCMLLWLGTVLQLLSDGFGSEQDASLGFAFVSLPAGVWKGLGKLCTDAARCGCFFFFFRSSFIYIYIYIYMYAKEVCLGWLFLLFNLAVFWA